MVDPTLKLNLFDQLSRVAKALSSGKRLELLELLAQREQSVENLASTSQLRLTTVSSHLQVMKSAGLVSTRRNGTTIFYRLAGPEVAALIVQLQTVAKRRLPDVVHAWDIYADSVDGEPMTSLANVANALLLDVRPRAEFDAGHHPDAMSIPLDELQARIDEIPRERPTVVYCRGAFCKMANDAARLLRASGRHASAMDEGVLEWRASGLVTLAETA